MYRHQFDSLRLHVMWCIEYLSLHTTAYIHLFLIISAYSRRLFIQIYTVRRIIPYYTLFEEQQHHPRQWDDSAQQGIIAHNCSVSQL